MSEHPLLVVIGALLIGAAIPSLAWLIDGQRGATASIIGMCAAGITWTLVVLATAPRHRL